MNDSPVLETRALTVSIGRQPICRSLDLSLAAGGRLAILGRNGAGKSTLLSVLAGLRRPDAGQVALTGKNLTELPPRAVACLRGWLGQYRPDSFASSVLETALTGRHPHLGRWDWESREDIACAREALAAVGLSGFDDRDVYTLSGGERQRLSIATLLTQAPALYLLDEPLTHLDLNHQIAVLELFGRLAREQGKSVVMVLHDPGLAWRYCDRALLIFGDGETALGPVDTILCADHLSRLYGHPLREIEDDGGSGRQRWFVPA